MRYPNLIPDFGPDPENKGDPDPDSNGGRDSCSNRKTIQFMNLCSNPDSKGDPDLQYIGWIV